jgi:hypothetical protein
MAILLEPLMIQNHSLYITPGGDIAHSTGIDSSVTELLGGDMKNENDSSIMRGDNVGVDHLSCCGN